MKSKSFVITIASVAVLVGVLSLVARNQSNAQNEPAALLFLALQIVIALALITKKSSVRWIAAILWAIQGIACLVTAGVFLDQAAGHYMLSIIGGVVEIACVVALLSPVAGEYFRIPKHLTSR